jgi:hypothetical protein
VVIFSGWTTGVPKSSRCDFTAYTTNVAVPGPETGRRRLANGKFSGLDRDTTLAFLRDLPTPGQAGKAALARMAAFCARHGSSGRTSPEILTGQLRAPLLSAGEGTVTGKAFTVLLFAELLNGQLRALNTRITSLAAVHPDAPAARRVEDPGMDSQMITAGPDTCTYPCAGGARNYGSKGSVRRSAG